MLVFPTYLFDFAGAEVDIERRRVSGGEALSGDETTILTDGGGRVFAEYAEPHLDPREHALAWRALSDHLADQPIIVPLGDVRHQMVREVHVPPGGLPWWTEAEYIAGQETHASSAEAAFRATQIDIAIIYHEVPLRPGMWFSIRHAAWCHRAYRIKQVISQTSAAATVTFNPPLREAVPSGTRIELADPLCTMRLDGVMRSPADMGFAEGSGCRLVEDFRGVYP